MGQGVPGHPPAPITAVTVPDNRFTVEGHDLVIVEVGHADTHDNSVLYVPDLGLVVAGDVIYNGAHLYLGESVAVGGFGPWREAIGRVEALEPRHIVAGHQNRRLDDAAERTIAETREYLDDADELLHNEEQRCRLLQRQVERYPNLLARTVHGRVPAHIRCPRTARSGRRQDPRGRCFHRRHHNERRPT